jgi:cytochrome c5
MKKIVLALALVVGFTYAYALDQNKGDVAKGKQLYREVCRSCHDGSKAKKLTPMHKTMAQWKRLFDNDMAKLKEKHQGNEQFNKISSDDFVHIYRFVMEGALDSEQPQTCD